MKIVSYIFMHSDPLHTMMLKLLQLLHCATRRFMYATLGTVFAALAFVLCLLH